MAIGVIELLAGLASLVPKSATFGAIVLMVVMAGATATHIAYREMQVVTTIAIILLLGATLVIRRAKRRTEP